MKSLEGDVNTFVVFSWRHRVIPSLFSVAVLARRIDSAERLNGRSSSNGANHVSIHASRTFDARSVRGAP